MAAPNDMPSPDRLSLLEKAATRGWSIISAVGNIAYAIVDGAIDGAVNGASTEIEYQRVSRSLSYDLAALESSDTHKDS